MEIRGGVATPGKLLLSTAETTVVDGNKLGQIDFQAPVDSAGTDAILVGASIYAEADATFSASVNATELVFATGASEAAAEKMRITSDGKVGIGTTAPATDLHIRNGTGNAQCIVESETGSADFKLIAGQDGGADTAGLIFVQDATTKWDLTMKADNTFRLYNHATSSEAISVLADGKVGIGTTTPGNLLNVVGTADNAVVTALQLENTDWASSETGQGVMINFKLSQAGTAQQDAAQIIVSKDSPWHDNAARDAHIAFKTTEDATMTERVRISHDGKVGIGTTAPARLLHIYGSGTGTEFYDGHLTLEGTTAANPVGMAFINRGNVSSYSDLGHIRMEIDSGNAKGKMTFSTRNSDGGNSDTGVRMTIKSTGNVGIGTTAPFSLLHVHGKAMGTFSMGECIYAKTITHQSNNNLNASLGINWSELSQAGTVFHMRIYGAMNTLTDAINFFECIIGYRNDYGGTLKQVITQKYASHGSTAGAAVTYDVTAVGSGNGSNAIYVTSSLQSGGSSSYDMCHYITIHRVDARSSGAMFRQS